MSEFAHSTSRLPSLARDDWHADAKFPAQLFATFDGFVRLSISDPVPFAGFLRLAWITFSSAVAAKQTLETIQAAFKPAPTPEARAKSESAPVEAAGEATPKTDANGDAEIKDAAPTNGVESAPTAEGATQGKAENGADAPEAHDDKPAEEPKPYAIGSYDLSALGVLSIRMQPVEIRMRATPALCSSPDRLAKDVETALKAVEAAEKRVREDEGAMEEDSGAQASGSAVIRRKMEEWEKEVEEKKEKESLEQPAYEAARAGVVSRLHSARHLGRHADPPARRTEQARPRPRAVVSPRSVRHLLLLHRRLRLSRAAERHVPSACPPARHGPRAVEACSRCVRRPHGLFTRSH